MLELSQTQTHTHTKVKVSTRNDHPPFDCQQQHLTSLFPTIFQHSQQQNQTRWQPSIIQGNQQANPIDKKRAHRCVGVAGEYFDVRRALQYGHNLAMESSSCIDQLEGYCMGLC